MIDIHPEKRWLLWLVLSGIGFLFLKLFQPILMPFVMGALIAYLLNPAVNKMENCRFVPRWLATLTVMIVFFGLFFTAIGLTVPLIYRESTDLIKSAPEWLNTLKQFTAPYIEQIKPFTEKVQENQEPMLDNLPSIGKEIGTIASRAFGFIMAGGQAVMGAVSLMVLMPIVTFYLLHDWHKVVKAIERLIPRKEAPTIHQLWVDINNRLSGFLRGQLGVCVILSFVYVIALMLVGLNYAVVIGLLAGMLSFIPFIGSVVGLIAATSVAWLQFQSIGWVAAVLAIFMAGQILEGNFLTPKLVGEKIGLHPLWVIFALMAGGSLMGFVGMLIALPVAAVIGVLVRFALLHYTSSAAYNHSDKK